MPTNEERRKVAARLRNWESFRETFMESPICAALYVLNVEGYLDWRGVCELLADLIEPEPERTCHPFSGIVLGGPECREEKVWRCSECEEVLSWDYEGYDPETDGPAYCEHCGSKVTGTKVVG